jgi:hypothetical protein
VSYISRPPIKRPLQGPPPAPRPPFEGGGALHGRFRRPSEDDTTLRFTFTMACVAKTGSGTAQAIVTWYFIPVLIFHLLFKMRD